MDRWILDGYLCRNAGDDMMIAELCVANPEMRFEAPDLAGGEGPSLTRIPNLSTGRRSPWLLRACLVEGYVMCGGSMFIDHRQGLRARAQFLRRWMRRILVAMVLRVRRKSVQVVGCNLGPVETPWGRFIFPVFLWLATRVSVRDSASVALLQSWGVDNVEKAPDMVLSYLARPEVTRRLPESGLASAVGVSVMEWPGVPRATVLDRYASMV
ncbi:polysaccharide pyruvyl transferase family protein, partial [Nocardioides massiliensis]|uniref:polysaccharide pyruvyl transferase family protein n=1 Tax=Nocardioides massiliensis TaxID=1325935 RepID=UPI0015ECB853